MKSDNKIRHYKMGEWIISWWELRSVTSIPFFTKFLQYIICGNLLLVLIRNYHWNYFFFFLSTINNQLLRIFCEIIIDIPFFISFSQSTWLKNPTNFKYFIFETKDIAIYFIHFLSLNVGTILTQYQNVIHFFYFFWLKGNTALTSHKRQSVGYKF